MAGARIVIEIDDSKAMNGLSELLRRIKNLEPVFEEIGEVLLKSTDDRWGREEAPDGTPWEQLSPVTFAKKSKNQDKILVESGHLREESLSYFASSDSLEFGTSSKYGATHQFGAKQGAFGKNRRGAPIPWGDIPARPFLGLSDEDEMKIVAVVRRYLSDAVD